MDRNLTKQEINAQKRKQFIRIGIPAVAVIAVIAGAIIFSRDSVNRRELNMALTDRGTIESSVTATGKVVPAFEQAITSPITARIVEVYCNPGDSLEEGTPLLLLDLQSTQTEVDRQQDQRQKQVYEIEQQRLDNETRLTSLEMQIRVKEMAVDRLKTEVANRERHAQIKNYVPEDFYEKVYRTYYLNRTSYCGIVNAPAWGYKEGKSSPPQNWGAFITAIREKLQGDDDMQP